MYPPVLLTLFSASIAVANSIAAHDSYWYDWGLYGAYPRRSYKSFSSASPWLNIVKSDQRCEDGYSFIEPRGESVPSPGPIILDNEGNLVWMETKYGQAMDLKVQNYKGKDYLTFWHGDDSGWFGRGYYLMLDDSYNIFKNVTAAGDLDGDLHEFQITADNTALLTAYEARPADLTAYGVENGLIYDSLFQEIDLETGELLFAWRASDHYRVTDSLGPYEQYNGAWDFFHINSVDKDPLTGNYLVSSRYMCAVAYVDGKTGSILWQVGGKNNSFADLSDGHATDFSWQHHARLHHETATNSTLLLTVFDNGAYYTKPLLRADHSRGLLVTLDTNAMTATLRHALVAPQGFLVPSQGSVNILPETGNVLVGWGHHPAWTEYDAETGEVLCDTHLGATRLTAWSRVKSYRTFKSKWTGRPETSPDAVLALDEEMVYVSWNGATEVKRWVVQTTWASDNKEGNEDEDEDEDDNNNDNNSGLFLEMRHWQFSNVTSAEKEGFETRISLAGRALGDYVQVIALDANGKRLGSSELIDAWSGLYVSGKSLPVPESLGLQGTQIIFCAALVGMVVSTVLLVKLRSLLCQTAVASALKVKSIVAKASRHKYDVLPQNESREMLEARVWERGQQSASGGARSWQ